MPIGGILVSLFFGWVIGYKSLENFKPSNKNLKYLITDTKGKILKNSYDLKILIKNINWKKL